MGLKSKLREWRSAREAIRDAAAFHRESRARIADLAARGQSHVALAENVGLLGIDMATRPTVHVRFKGLRPDAVAPRVDMPAEALLGVAVARGCDHYSTFAKPADVRDDPTLRHELLACALCRGDRTVATFQNIRVAAMLLSSFQCDAEAVIDGATALNVGGRVAHIAQLGSIHDPARGDYWRAIVAALPAPDPEEAEFLPGLSRFTTETGRSGPRGGFARVWLRAP